MLQNIKQGIFAIVPDTLFLRIKYLYRMKKILHIDNPTTFNEKMQWLKLYFRKPVMTTMVDKIEAKKYVSSIIGNQYIIPTIAVYNSVDEIDWESLPNQFVIKCSHDSGGLIVCKDKATLDIVQAKKKLRAGLKRTYFYANREWPYKNVAPRLICEEYISNNENELEDYKIHNFNNGEPIVLVCKNRFSNKGLTEDFFDKEWNHLPIARPKHPNSQTPIPMPQTLEKMLILASILSKDFPFLRTDFYSVGGKIYFGELTFFPATGMTPFVPDKWDLELGNRIRL